MPAPDDGAVAQPDPLAGLVGLAVAGDARALESLCRELQDFVYRLSLRFLSDPEEAADATQEILIRVVTHLADFQGRSRLTTWVYTIASRHLLRTRRGAVEVSVQGPAESAQWLDANLADVEPNGYDEAEHRLLAGEVRLACTYGMLLALSRELRIAYLLGDLIGLPDREGAEVLDITPAAFRQRLARARRTMRHIIADRCGLVDAANPCSCSRQIESSIAYGILDPARPAFSSRAGVRRPVPVEVLTRAAEQLDVAERLAEVYRADPQFQAPARVWATLQRACPALTGA